MANQFSHPRLTVKIVILLALFLVLFAVSGWRTRMATEAQQFDGVLINRLGLQRMLVQKYVAHIHRVIVGLAVGDWEVVLEHKDKATKTAEAFERAQQAFFNGGELELPLAVMGSATDGETEPSRSGMSEDSHGQEEIVSIPPIQEESTRNALKLVDAKWRELHRSALMALRSDRWKLKNNEYVDRLVFEADETIRHLSNVAQLMQQSSTKKLDQLNSLQVGFLIAAGVLFLFTLLFVDRIIVLSLARSFAEKEQLKQEAEHLALVARYTDSAVVIANQFAEIEWVNEGFTRITEYSLDEVAGQWAVDLLQGKDTCADTVAVLQSHFNQGEGCNVEIAYYSRSGEKRWFAVEMRPIRDETGAVANFMVVHTDITARKEAEAALDSAIQRAELANHAKSQFLANMSHEIRTPLTAILGYTEILAEDDGLAQDVELRLNSLQTIRRNGEHLLSLINDILDLSKIEAGKLSVESIVCRPLELIDEVIALMKVRADSKDLVLETSFETPMPEQMVSDPTRIRQILVNLVGNAIKFTETGAVQVIARLLNSEEPRLEFDIVDSGMGLTEEQRQLLFQPFVQADGSMTRRFGGTGLGLTISRRLAELLGGEMEIVESQPGVGTRFRFSIATGPLSGVHLVSLESEQSQVPIDQRDSANVPSTSLHGFTLLLAEDGVDNQRLIGFVLRKAGANLKVVDNGELAVEAALEAWRNGKPFDVILMDMQMPVLDGYKAATRLRHQNYSGPIIALTAHAMSGDRQKCLEAGCDDYATKPIDRARLLAQVATHASTSRNACLASEEV